jgi:hypothetical protein
MKQLDFNYLKYEIIIPVLNDMDLNSGSAVNLLLGTAAQESHFGTYIRQIGFDNKTLNGGFGIYQIELLTCKDVLFRYFPQHRPDLHEYCLSLKKDGASLQDELMNNHKFSTAICRGKYLEIAKSLPDEYDIEGLAKYWKKYYNTEKGKGTVEDFVKNYKKFCL